MKYLNEEEIKEISSLEAEVHNLIIKQNEIRIQATLRAFGVELNQL